jgi:NADH-quinone oxidoreductase subunit G
VNRDGLGCEPGTGYASRKRISGMDISLGSRQGEAEEKPKTAVKVCAGTSCFLRVLHAVEEVSLDNFFEVQTTFCSEQCDRGPTVRIGDEEIYRADPEAVVVSS